MVKLGKVGHCKVGHGGVACEGGGAQHGTSNSETRYGLPPGSTQ